MSEDGDDYNRDDKMSKDVYEHIMENIVRDLMIMFLDLSWIGNEYHLLEEL